MDGLSLTSFRSEKIQGNRLVFTGSSSFFIVDCSQPFQPGIKGHLIVIKHPTSVTFAIRVISVASSVAKPTKKQISILKWRHIVLSYSPFFYVN